MLTVSEFVPLCVSALATPIAVNEREFTVADATSSVTVAAAAVTAVFPMTTSSAEVGTACLPYAIPPAVAFGFGFAVIVRCVLSVIEATVPNTVPGVVWSINRFPTESSVVKNVPVPTTFTLFFCTASVPVRF